VDKREMTKLALEALRGGYIDKAYGLTEETLEKEILPEKNYKEWEGLTKEEIKEGWQNSWVDDEQVWESAVWWAEAKLKEKNDEGNK